MLRLQIYVPPSSSHSLHDFRVGMVTHFNDGIIKPEFQNINFNLKGQLFESQFNNFLFHGKVILRSSDIQIFMVEYIF